MKRIAARLVALLALMAAAGTCRAEYPDAWKWTIGAGASAFSPRMHGIDNALAYEGLNVLDMAWRGVGAQPTARVPVGLAKVEWGFGSQVSVAYEFNEDLRGGVFIGMGGAWKSDRVVTLTDHSTYQITATVIVATSTTYSMDEKISLPLLTIGFFLHKVFRYEEEPSLRTYIGGWGAYGALSGATVSGNFKARGAEPIPFSTDLTAEGWGAGGLVGVEYAVARNVAAYGETGFDWCIIPKVQWLGREGGAGRLATSANKPINIDYSGFFIRIGVKVALAGPS